MASLVTIPQFFGFKKSFSDNLMDLGYAKIARNVDTTDGALQSLIGSTSFPAGFTTGGYSDGRLIDIDQNILTWRRPEQQGFRCVTKNQVFDEMSPYPVAARARVFTQAEQDRLAPFCSYPWGATHFLTTINGVPSTILGSPFGAAPCIIEDGEGEHDCKIRDFGTGMFLTSDAITARTLDSNNAVDTVTIGRVMTDDEKTRCLLAGVYIMASASDEEDYVAAYVSDVTTDSTKTVITFASPIADSGAAVVGHYVKVRGGLSNMSNYLFTELYGRLFAAGDPEHPRRLCWSCLPGDGRTIEDWTADDASVDTGGGHVEVGSKDKIVALFSTSTQLLIFKQHELYRLYGTTPSQFTLERVFQSETLLVNSHSAVADANGVPYWANADGLWAYNGSAVVRVDTDRSFQKYLHNFPDNPPQVDLLYCYETPTHCVYWKDCLFILVSTTIVMYDLVTGAMTEIKSSTAGYFIDLAVNDKGVIYSLKYYDLLKKQDTWHLLLFLYEPDTLDISGDTTSEWEGRYHYFDRGNEALIDAVWESPYISFGESSYRKKLTRMGFEITGSIKLTISTPNGDHYEREFVDLTNRCRRFEWLTIDMPFDTSLRFRIESVDGRPFRIHSGLDLYVELSKRN